jgi:selenide,water dikinase
MLRLNRHASHLVVAARLSAATDISGFGLLGHLWEMAERSGVDVTVDSAAAPLLEGALEASRMGFHTGGEGRNRDWVGSNVSVAPTVEPELAALLFDPQTSGGLLIGCPPKRAPALESAFARDSEPLWRIGRADAGTPAIHVF